MQVKYKVNISDKAILNKRTLDRIDNELGLTGEQYEQYEKSVK